MGFEMDFLDKFMLGIADAEKKGTPLTREEIVGNLVNERELMDISHLERQWYCVDDKGHYRLLQRGRAVTENLRNPDPLDLYLDSLEQ